MATGRTLSKFGRFYTDGWDLSGYVRSFGPLVHTFEEVDLTCMADAVKGAFPGKATISPGELRAVLANTGGTELVTNGTMEADANWANVGTPAANAQSDAQAYAGTYSRLFTPDAANEGIQGDVYTTITGLQYAVDLYVYPDDGTTVTVTVRKGDNSADVYDQSHTGLTQDQWNHIQFAYTETAGGAGAYIKIDSGASTSGDWYVDNVSVKQMGGPHGSITTAGTGRVVMAPIGIQAAPAAGCPAFCGQFEQLGYRALEEGGGVFVDIPFGNWDVTAMISYELPWGLLLHANSSSVAANTAVGIDCGATTYKGGYMVYQVFSGDGTITLKVDHSTTTNENASFSNLGGCTSGELTATSPQAGIVETTATTTTVGRYLRWQVTAGTATSCYWALAFVRGR